MADEPYGRDGGDDEREGPAEPDWGTHSDVDQPSSGEQERIPMNLSRDEADEQSATDDEDDDADPHAPEPGSARIEAGDPDLENVVFVLIGAVAMLLVIAHVVSLPL